MVLLEAAKDDELSQRDNIVKENDKERHSHASSSYEESHSHVSSPTKGDCLDTQSAAERPSRKEETPEAQEEDALMSCIQPLMKKIEENLHHEFAYVDRLQNFVDILQEENKNLKEEIDDLKEFIFSSKLSLYTSERQDMANLQSKVEALKAALRIEILKANEYKNELDDARHVLMRRTRARVKKGQSFELIIAQKPQEVALADYATPFQDETYTVSCPICLDELDIASGWYTLNCKHRYHLVCLAQMMPTRARCCVCNQELHKLLYEIFGMANRYPDDARLWDAQTGHPVDFTLEEDIRALANEIQESEETQEEADEEEAGASNAGEEITIESDYIGGDRDQSGDEFVESQPDDHETEEVEENEESTSDEGSSTDEDSEDDEDYSEGEESHATSAEEEDPTDPDYTPIAEEEDSTNSDYTPSQE